MSTSPYCVRINAARRQASVASHGHRKTESANPRYGVGVPFGTPVPAHVLALYPGTVSAIVIAHDSGWSTCDRKPADIQTALFSPIAREFGPPRELCAERWEEFYAARKARCCRAVSRMPTETGHVLPNDAPRRRT